MTPVEKWWTLPDALTYRNLNGPLLLEAAASCHLVTRFQGAYVGDPLDITMFQFTGWQLDENTNWLTDQVRSYVYPKEVEKSPYKCGIVKRF